MGIGIVDTDFHILYVNKAFLDIFGYKNTEEATLSPPREHYTPESYAGYLLRHEHLLQGEPIPENLEIDIAVKMAPSGICKMFIRKYLGRQVPVPNSLYRHYSAEADGKTIQNIGAKLP